MRNTIQTNKRRNAQTLVLSFVGSVLELVLLVENLHELLGHEVRLLFRAVVSLTVFHCVEELKADLFQSVNPLNLALKTDEAANIFFRV